MKLHSTPPAQLWQDLRVAAERLQSTTITDLFADDPSRAANMRIETSGLTLDFSKTRIDKSVLKTLFSLLQNCDVIHKLEQQLEGGDVNTTERRPALHTAVRAAIVGQPAPLAASIRADYAQSSRFAQSLYLGQRKGASGAPILDVVNIGIGGSDLGPRMVTAALSHYNDSAVKTHFVSSLDSNELQDTLSALQPETTLFLVSSKSFSTEETLFNARRAIAWFCASRPESELKAHFAALTGNPEQATALGIEPAMVFPVPDWIGGRYSVWSASGMALAITIGQQRFEQFLQGGWQMDQHARNSALDANMPATLAALEVWHRNCLGYPALAIIPYSYQLRLLPAYLQQLVMESNGKNVTHSGAPTEHATAPLLWGTAGTEGQHSYHQLLHQGSGVIPVDFILPVGTGASSSESQVRLASHCLAQSKALMEGKTEAAATREMIEQGTDPAEARRLAPHRAMPGNRPSNTLVLEGLNPQTLGALLALYEHKTFFASALWDINPFDQWGVELGKQLSQSIFSVMATDSAPQFDPSTNALIALVRRQQPTK